MRDWIWLNGRWHIATGPRTGACGIEVVTPPDRTAAPDDEYPPVSPCQSCILNDALDNVVEEPIDAAKARGYVPFDPEG